MISVKTKKKRKKKFVYTYSVSWDFGLTRKIGLGNDDHVRQSLLRERNKIQEEIRETEIHKMIIYPKLSQDGIR